MSRGRRNGLGPPGSGYHPSQVTEGAACVGGTTTSSFHAPDLECEQCAVAVRAALESLDGVRGVTVDLGACLVRVDYDATRVTEAVIRAALDEVGYPTSP